MGRFFTAPQISLAGRSFTQAEKMAAGFFRLAPRQWKEHRYDVKTLAYLDEHEVREGAFAHLCMYGLDGGAVDEKNHFYRICLQDDRILDAVERANSFIRLAPLLLYIAAHELVHVIRFEKGEVPFEASDRVKSEEEETVHRITRSLLKPATDPDLNLVLDCFSNRYRIGDLVQ
ncbi:MAG TPA: hypothetical protein P5308_10880 [Syntrophales bacterium]|nr:hypothetical protein [Syntrophales bacterium]